MKVIKVLLCASAGIAALAVATGAAQAADLPNMKEAPVAPVIETGLPWFVRVGVAGVIFDSSASLKVAGAPLVGASAHANDNVTALFALGYYFTDNISAQLTGGWPPSTPLMGAGILAPAGKLGRVTYGPAVASVDYHLTNFGAFRPYVGGGVAYSIIFAQSDGAVSNLSVQGRFGGVIEGGFDYMLTRNWSFFVDAKKIWLTVGASGNVGPNPVTANVRLDPVIVSGGLSYHW